MHIHNESGGEASMKALALVIGIVLLAIGVSGFIPQLNTGGLLFGVMPMDQLRSILFIVTGVLGILIGVTRRRSPYVASGGDGHDLRDWT
jgi:hypothetical protein